MIKLVGLYQAFKASLVGGECVCLKIKDVAFPSSRSTHLKMANTGFYADYKFNALMSYFTLLEWVNR